MCIKKIAPLGLYLAILCFSPVAGSAQPLTGPESIMGFTTQQHTERFSAEGANTHLSFTGPSVFSLYGDRFPGSHTADFSVDLTQQSGRVFLYTSLKNWEYGSHRAFGWGVDNFNVYYQYGKSEGVVSSRQEISGLAPNFFHGSVQYPYAYNGATLGYEWSDHLHFHGGTIWIDADHLEKRTVFFGGFGYKNLTGTISSVRRDNESVGYRVSLGIQWRQLELGYQELVSNTDAQWREFGLAYRVPDTTDTLRLHVGSGENDLYGDVGDTRITLTYSFRWGGGKKSKEGKYKAHRSGVITELARNANRFSERGRSGLGEVGTGLAMSSGSPVLDTSPRFTAQNDAVYHILSIFNPVSVQNNLEYGSAIYRSRDGSYSPSQTVVEGTPTAVVFNPYFLVPAGTVATADWHTHGADIPGYLNEQFSHADIFFSIYYNMDGYLGTPAGRMFMFEMESGTIYQFVAPGGHEFILPN